MFLGLDMCVLASQKRGVTERLTDIHFQYKFYGKHD
jgi:hypothetical protein